MPATQRPRVLVPLAPGAEEMETVIDAVNVDLKSFRDAYYRKICGATLEPVLESIRRSVEKGMWVEVTNSFFPLPSVA